MGEAWVYSIYEAINIVHELLYYIIMAYEGIHMCTSILINITIITVLSGTVIIVGGVGVCGDN